MTAWIALVLCVLCTVGAQLYFKSYHLGRRRSHLLLALVLFAAAVPSTVLAARGFGIARVYVAASLTYASTPLLAIRLFGEPRPFDQAFDPALNRRVGIAYLAFLQESILPRQAEWQADERSLLLAAYNAGPGRLRRSGFDLDRMPSQTQDYVDRAGALHDAYLGDVASVLRARLSAAL